MVRAREVVSEVSVMRCAGGRLWIWARRWEAERVAMEIADPIIANN